MKILDKFTGKEVEEKVKEYSDIYGEVLLGMHREIKSFEQELNTNVKKTENLQSDTKKLLAEVKKYHSGTVKLFWLSIVLIFLAAISIGISIWIAT